MRGRQRGRMKRDDGGRVRLHEKPESQELVDDELTPRQMRELQRRIDDLDDATRFLLVSQMTPRFALYYNVIDDVYVANDPKGATLFKRRRAAAAVKALLGKSVRIVRCQSKQVNGVRIPVLDLGKRRRATEQRG